MCLLDVVSGREKGGDIPGQRRRVARNISDAGRPKFLQISDHYLAGPGAGRVQDDQVRTFSHRLAFSVFALQVILGSRADRFHVRLYILQQIAIRCP